jgi:alpha-mannosidase
MNEPMPDPSSPFIIHLITHNPWDREWIFTVRYANRWLPTFFKNLFEMLETQPDYRFVLDGKRASSRIT